MCSSTKTLWWVKLLKRLTVWNSKLVTLHCLVEIIFWQFNEWLVWSWIRNLLTYLSRPYYIARSFEIWCCCSILIWIHNMKCPYLIVWIIVFVISYKQFILVFGIDWATWDCTRSLICICELACESWICVECKSVDVEYINYWDQKSNKIKKYSCLQSNKGI